MKPCTSRDVSKGGIEKRMRLAGPLSAETIRKKIDFLSNDSQTA